jgi:uncharacterized protein YjbI with pentapeptide repeats
VSDLPPLDELFPGPKRDPDGVLDLRGLDLRGRDFGGRSLTRIRFGTKEETGEQPALLEGVSFRSSSLVDVHFTRTRLERNDFRGAELRSCDFRYVTCTRSTFANTKIIECDFYRAYFEASVIFSKATLTRVSLDKAWLQGATDLQRAMFDDPATGPALVQDADDEAYRRFLEPTKSQRLLGTAGGELAPDDIASAIRDKRLRAAQTYRTLSAVWASGGHFDDATFAYVRSKELERQHFRSRLAAGRRGRHPGARTQSGALTDLGGFLWRSLARWSCNYGDSLGRIVLLVLALVLGPGTFYALTGSVENDHGHTVHSWLTCLLFSLEQITTLSSGSLQPATRLVELAGSLQTLIGIALLGLFGFVLGNKIRNS